MHYSELLSEQQLSALIPPSLRYLLTVATHRHPRYLLRALNSFDEIYALLMLAVERHFLRTYGGSFTENFYGLKRERVLRIKGGEVPRTLASAPELVRETLKLSDADIWKNLAVLVGLPYLKRKLDEGFELYGARQTVIVQMGPNYRRDELPPHPTIRQRLFWYYRLFLRRIYPGLNAAYHFLLLAFSLAYLFDNTKYSSPFLWLVGTRIRRLSDADYRAIELAAQSPSSTSGRPETIKGRSSQSLSNLNPMSLASLGFSRLFSSLKILLPTSIFALKFLEWWHASDFAQQLSKKAVEGLDLPPPTVSGLPPSSRAASNKQGVSDTIPNRVALSGTPSSYSELNTDISLNSTAPTSMSDIPSASASTHPRPPVSSLTQLPIHTVPAPSASTSALCPICRHPIQTPTSAQTGYVFCYACIFKWVDGTHERQIAFMDGTGAGEEWRQTDEEEEIGESKTESEGPRSKEGLWESGKGRCAVTGRRILGGTDGLRRVIV